jgi:hypothetical protein
MARHCERAHAAARREFFAHGLTGTRGRTGVLVYVALAERYAEIVADKGVRAPKTLVQGQQQRDEHGRRLSERNLTRTELGEQDQGPGQE